MRTVVLFALALSGLALVTEDAAAGHCRKKKAHADCGCGGGGYAAGGYGGYGAPGGYGAYGRYGYVDTGMSGTAYAGAYTGTMAPAAMMGGRSSTIQTSDGRTYVLGADGNYYSAASGVTAGYMGQPYPGSMNRGSTSFYTPGVMPAGGTAPLTMPGTNVAPSPTSPQR